jgi:peptidoglycan hydrolase-like protein with peptidoglycan-binding domain
MTTTKATIGAVAVTAAIIAATAVPATAATTSRATAPRATAPRATSTAAALAATAVKAPQLQPWPVLRQGANSGWPRATIRSLQYLLVARGAKLPVDGVFGHQTKLAVVAFQRARHLTADGVAGAATWRALLVTLSRGSTGAAVRAVQDQANFRNGGNGHSLDVDGRYGAKTVAWVRAFQHALAQEIPGFPVDGIVGARTWQALVTEALSG